MIKLNVLNMSCGHCRLKITSILESNEYKVDSIDMIDQSIVIDTTMKSFQHIKGLLDDIGNPITLDQTFAQYKEIIYWQTKLEDDAVFKQVINFIDNEGYNIVEFSDEPLGLKILADTAFIDELNRYINHL